TSSRDSALHACPLLKKACSSALGITASRSASSRTRFGDFPPSSRQTRFTPAAASAATRAPERTLPVSDTTAISGWVTSASPTPGPLPHPRLHTPAGTPAAWVHSAKPKALGGAPSLGFR